jgi:hypothetical protein
MAVIEATPLANPAIFVLEKKSRSTVILLSQHCGASNPL